MSSKSELRPEKARWNPAMLGPLPDPLNCADSAAGSGNRSHRRGLRHLALEHARGGCRKDVGRTAWWDSLAISEKHSSENGASWDMIWPGFYTVRLTRAAASGSCRSSHPYRRFQQLVSPLAPKKAMVTSATVSCSSSSSECELECRALPRWSKGDDDGLNVAVDGGRHATLHGNADDFPGVSPCAGPKVRD